jgi:hypothetical protein
MTGCPQSQQVLTRVQRRLFVAKIAVRTFWTFLTLSSLYAILLLVSRLTGLIPDVFASWTLALPPALALLLALVWPARLSLADAARAVDRVQRTRDLFLTLVLIEKAPGGYQPLVMGDAEQAAAKVKPPQIVPFPWERRTAAMVGIMAALMTGIGLLPTFDPFGKVAQAKEEASQERMLVESKKATEIRKAQLKEQDVDAANSPDVEKAIEKLKFDLKGMKKDQPKSNREKLAIDQKILGDKFRATNEAVKNLMNQAGVDQKFGSQNAMEFKKWQEEMQQGSSESMSKAMEEMKNDLEMLARTDDPLKKTELERKIEKRLKALADFAGERAGSKSLQAALNRAKEQLDAVKAGKEMSIDAMKAMQDTLDVAKMELEQVAQSARDMKALEEALETLSMAKKLNEDGQLNGAMSDSLTAMEEYKELYQELMAQMGMDGEGEGEGDGSGDDTGGDGMGRGGDPEEEDESTKTDFVSEQTKTPIQKGKILMSLKQKGLSESGEAKREFQAILNDVKQGYAEAIDAEQIPPGYREGIKTYFDSLGESETAPATPSESQP